MGVGFELMIGFCCQLQHSHSRIKTKYFQIQQVNLAVLKQLTPEQAEVEICLAVPTEAVERIESELDEMWSYVFPNKSNSRAVSLLGRATSPGYGSKANSCSGLLNK